MNEAAYPLTSQTIKTPIASAESPAIRSMLSGASETSRASFLAKRKAAAEQPFKDEEKSYGGQKIAHLR